MNTLNQIKQGVKEFCEHLHLIKKGPKNYWNIWLRGVNDTAEYDSAVSMTVLSLILSVNDTAESDSAVSMTLQILPPQCQWQCWAWLSVSMTRWHRVAGLSGVNDTATNFAQANIFSKSKLYSKIFQHSKMGSAWLESWKKLCQISRNTRVGH